MMKPTDLNRLQPRRARSTRHVVPTKTSPWPTRLWQAGGVCAVLGLLAFGGYLDDQARVRQMLAEQRHKQQLANAFEEGRQAGEQTMVRTALAAWEAAMTEADVCRQRAGVRQ